MTTKPETDDEILRRITAAQATIDVATRNKKQAEAELLARRKSEIDQLLKAKDEPYGKVDIIVGNHKIAVTIPKKIEWDDDKLAAIAKLMVADGQDPNVYMKIEHSVSETVYKNWSKEMQDYFAVARTVKVGTVSLKITEEKGE